MGLLNFRLPSRYGPSAFLALRGALAVAVSWQIATWIFGAQGATLAPISALIVLQPTGWQTVRRAGERLAGVVLGVSIAALAAHFLGINFGTVILVVLAGYLVGFAVQKRGAYLALQVPISATLGLLVGGHGAQGGVYPVERTLGAVIGGVIGTVLSLLLTPPFYVEQARASVADSARAMADALPPLAAAFTNPADLAERQRVYEAMRSLEEQLEASEQALALGVESTRLNIWARNVAQRLDDYPLIVLNLQRVMRQLRRIAYTLQEEVPDRGDIAHFSWARQYATLLSDVQSVLTRMTDRMRPDGPSPLGSDDLQAALDALRQSVQTWERSLDEDAHRAPLPSSTLALRGALLLDMQRMVTELEAASAVIHHPQPARGEKQA